jgi:SAM-dependent methyltransferase
MNNIAALLEKHGLEGEVVRLSSPDCDLAAAVPEGKIGFLEFRAYPGARFEELLQELVAIHCGAVEDLEEFVGQASAILEFLAENGQTIVFRHFVAAELERLSTLSGDALVAALSPRAKAYRRHEIETAARAAGLECVCGPVDFSPASYALLYRDPDMLPESCADTNGPVDNALYQELEYPSYLHPQLHPDRLATMAWMFGLEPADPQTCRYLELGCGTAHSLIAFANDLSGARFFGVDFSQGMIDSGRRASTELGLKNLTLTAADLLEYPEAGTGRFDYIVLHGMFSWTPDAVRDRMLEICRDHLADNGVAYISFNALPGYVLPAMWRDVALSGGRKMTAIADAEAGIARIRALPFGELPEARRELLQPSLDNVVQANPQQVIFDEFADINEAYRISEVCEMAAQYGLQFVTEAGIENWTARTLSPAAQQLLTDLAGDPVRRMEYRDCLRLTRFHSALFCRAGRKPATSPRGERAMQLLVSTRAYPVSAEPEIRGPGKESFASPGGAEVALGDPFLKSILQVLHECRPRRLTVPELVRLACERAGLEAVESAAERLAPLLLAFWETGMIDLFRHMPKLAPDAGESPLASAFARICAGTGSLILPSLLGCASLLDSDEEARLVCALDGTKDRASLSVEFGLDVAELDTQLRKFARMGLLLR